VNEASGLSTPLTGTDLNLEALKDRIRKQAARQRAAAEAGLGGTPADIPGFNWPQVQACLNSAARLASAPGAVPTLGRFGGATRLLARLALRGFHALARVMKVRQADVNARLLEALRETAQGLRDLEKQVVRQGERIQSLEALLWRQEPRKTGS